MMTSKAKEDHTLQYDKYYFNDQINKIVSSQIRKFEEVIRYYIFFNSFFASLASVQIVLFSVFFSALSRSSVLSYSLAVIFSLCLLILFYASILEPESRKNFLRSESSLLPNVST
jgi:hypothetical protein